MESDSSLEIHQYSSVAIMFTDLVGSTLLMEKDEERGLETIHQNRRIHEACLEANNGKLLKELGDGYLATFENAVDAINCALQIQGQAGHENLELPIRIGLNYGEIAEDREDVFGMGVVTASRIQSITDPGGIYFSKALFEKLSQTHQSQAKFMGEVPLKNIKYPVPVYALTDERLPEPDKRRIVGIIKHKARLRAYRSIAVIASMALIAVVTWFFNTYEFQRPQIIKTVAVFPLEVETDEEESEYLITGLTNELIYQLSEVKSLYVLSQHSTKEYYASFLGHVDTGPEISADYYVDGKIQVNDDSLVVEISLYDSTGFTQWNDSYRGIMSGSRKLWGEVASDLAHEMGIFVPLENSQAWAGTSDVNPETYRYYLQGFNKLANYSPDVAKGFEYLNKAIDQDPSDAYTYAWLAQGYITLGHSPYPTEDYRDRALAAALRSLQLDSTLAEGWAALATIKTYYEWDWKGAEQAFNRANELNPSLPMNRYHYAWYLALFGRMDEAIREHRIAQKLDPFISLHTAWLGELYRSVGEYDKAIVECEAALHMDEQLLGTKVLADTYMSMGKTDEAIRLFEENVHRPPWGPLFKYFDLAPNYIRVGRIEEGKAILEELENEFDSIPSPFGALCRVRIYGALGDKDKAFEWMKFRPHHVWLAWMRGDPVIDEKVKSDPRFAEILKEMNLSPTLTLVYNPEESTP